MSCLCGKATKASEPTAAKADKPKEEVFSKTLLGDESVAKPTAAKVVEEEKLEFEVRHSPSQELKHLRTAEAPPQGSRWCLVEHIMKEGADSETTSGWWAGSAKMDADAWTNMYKNNASKGLYNHWFLPMSKTEMYCLWELREGVSEATLQACLDNEVCPVANNKLMFIDGNLNGGVYGFDSKFAPGQDPEALPPSNEVGEHCLYLVKHDMKPEKKEEWWKVTGELFADAEFGKKFADYCAENHIVNHAMFPISQDCIYCLWEAKTSASKQAIEEILGPNGMVGRGACVNTFLEYDSKLTGGACFVSMKSRGAVVEDDRAAAAEEEDQETVQHQGSRWCLVEHIMKEGVDSQTTSGWWAGIAQMDAEAWTNMYKNNASKGLYNHWFLPMSKTTMYCLWELREGVSEATLQACLDNEVCPVANNKLMFIDGNLNGGVYGFDSKFAPGQDPEALPPSNEVGEHCLYLVKHDMKPEKKEEWWKVTGELFADAEFGKKFADYCAENHIVNHAMFPISQDCIYCLWEAKTSANKQAIEEILGPNGMVGRGACVNTFLEYDSRLTGGACFVTMKAKEAPVLAKEEPAITNFGMSFFSGCLTNFPWNWTTSGKTTDNYALVDALNPLNQEYADRR